MTLHDEEFVPAGTRSVRILFVEDSLPDVELCIRELKKAGLVVDWDVVERPEDFTERLRSSSYDLILSDYNLSGWNGLEALEVLRAEGRDLPFILVSGMLGDEAAVECMKRGVTDYVLKERLSGLPSAVERALEEKRLREESALAEDSLRISEQRFRVLLESAADAILGVTPEGRIELVNVQAEKMFGYTREELLGQSVDILVPEGRREVHRDHRKNYIASPHKRPMGAGLDLTARRKDGSEIPVEISLSPAEMDEGFLVTTIIRDVTERKKAEQALREGQRMLSTLMSNLPGMVYRCRPGKDRTLEFASEGCRELTGYPPSDLMGNRKSSYGQLIHPDDRRAVREGIDAGIRRRQPFQLTYRIGSANGVEKWVWEQGRGVFSSQGRLEALEGFITDISDQRALEQQFQHAQKMEAVGQLAAGVAHDFNNLLLVIGGYGELLLEGFRRDDPLRAKVREIQRAAERAQVLTKQLLTFTRKQPQEPNSLNLNHAVDQTGRWLDRVLGDDVELVIVQAEPLGLVRADAGQLEQVIMNLAVNARDAMPQGGTLKIETANRELDESAARKIENVRPGSYVCFSVSDDGIGMDSSTQARIFEPFFTTKPPGRGTGLGLSTVYGIVKQSGGALSVSSRPGKGTTFDVYFPRVGEREGGRERDSKAAAAEPDASLPQTAPAASSETVMVVDDDDPLRKLTREVFELEGYRVMEAGSGKEALKLSENHSGPIDVLVTDVVMPGMNGLDLARKLTGFRPELRVLYVSGYTDGTLSDLTDLPKDALLLQKPFSLDLLVRKVREVLELRGVN